MPFAIALARLSSAGRLCCADDVKSLALIALLPVTRWRRCPIALASSSLPCCARHEGPDAVSALGGSLLRHRRRRSLVTVALPSHLCYSVTVAVTLNHVAVASPSHCRRAAMVLMQRQLMLGAGARHRRSRPSRRKRSWRPYVAVAPSWGRRFDHCHRPGPHVALLTRSRAVAWLLLRHCRLCGHLALLHRTLHWCRDPCLTGAVAPLALDC